MFTGPALSLTLGSAVLPGSAYVTGGRVHARRAGHVDAALGGWAAVEMRRHEPRAPTKFGDLVALVAGQREWVLAVTALLGTQAARARVRAPIAWAIPNAVSRISPMYGLAEPVAASARLHSIGFSPRARKNANIDWRAASLRPWTTKPWTTNMSLELGVDTVPAYWRGVTRFGVLAERVANPGGTGERKSGR